MGGQRRASRRAWLCAALVSVLAVAVTPGTARADENVASFSFSAVSLGVANGSVTITRTYVGASTSTPHWFGYKCRNTSNNAYTADVNLGQMYDPTTPGFTDQATWALNCTSFGASYVASSVWMNTTSANPGTVGLSQTEGAPASTCTSSFSAVSAGLVGTQLTLYFTWAGTVPTGGWKLLAPNPVSGWDTATATATVSTVPVSGYLHRYGGAFTVASGITTYRVQSASAYGCYSAGTLASSPAEPGAIDDGATDPDNPSVTCGLNPFCYIKAALKWAFVPGETSMDAWQSLEATLHTRPPTSLVLGGVDYLNDAWNAYDDSLSCEAPLANGTNLATTRLCAAGHGPGYNGADFDTADGEHTVNPLTAAGELVQGSLVGLSIYWMIALGFWVYRFFDVWRMVGASFGGKSDT